MSDRKTDIVYRHWSRVIQCECRDLNALTLIGARALKDRDVRGNATLESMIGADIQKRRLELEQERDRKQSKATAKDSTTSQPVLQSEPTPADSPDHVRDVVCQLAKTLHEAISLGNEEDAKNALGKIHALHDQNSGVIQPETITEYQLQVSALQAHLLSLREQITSLQQCAVTAATRGSSEDLDRAMRRLTAIHAAHPRLLDEAELEKTRIATAQATDEHRQDKDTTRLLLKRQKAIAGKINALATTVRSFHQVACKYPESSDEFRNAEARYLDAIRLVDTYDGEWFSGVVLELADVLAEWTVPPPGAAGQIDRFLEGVSAGLGSIRDEIREMKSEQDSDENNQSESSAI